MNNTKFWVEEPKRNQGFSQETTATHVVFWPLTRPKKMPFQGNAPEGSDTF